MNKNTRKELDEIYPVIEQRKGLWGYRIELGFDEKGKRIQKTSYRKAYTKKTARIKALEFIEDLKKNEGKLLSNEDYTIDEFADIFMEYYEKKNENKLKPSSVQSRRYMTSRLKKDLKDYYIGKIDLKTYQKYLDGLHDTLSENYIHSINVHFKIMMDYAIKQGIRRDNIAHKAITKKVSIYASDDEDFAKDFLEYDELVEFLKFAKKNTEFVYYVAFYILAHTGMRPGELLALEWKDINIKDKSINIYKTIYHENDLTGFWEILTPKNKYSKRIVPIRKKDLDLLLELKEVQRIDWENRNKRLRSYDGDFIFTKQLYKGYPLNTSNLARKLRKVIEKGNFNKNITPHKFRHTHISILAEAGASLSEIKARVGHGEGKTTEKIYLHYTDVVKSNALNIYNQYTEETENKMLE